MQEKNKNTEKVLLILLPFWTSLIPPLGLLSLKSYLKKFGYHIKIIDASIELVFKELHNTYFNSVREAVPETQRGNFYNIGHDVFRKQMMAFLNYKNSNDYAELVKVLFYTTFYIDIDDKLIVQLNTIVSDFFTELEAYFLRLLKKENPTILGFSVYSDNLAPSIFCLKIAKEKYPHIKNVVGGGVFANQLAPGSENLDVFLVVTKSYLDKVIIGEGEILFHRFLNEQLPDTQKVFTLKDSNWENLDLNSFGSLDFSDIDVQNYPYMVNFISRGCPFQCNFCTETIQWGKYRKRDVKQVAQHMLETQGKTGSTLFFMSDSLLNPVISDLAQELIQRSASIYWDGYLRVDDQVCNKDCTLLWRKSGFYRARLGIESGSPNVLTLMRKKITPEQIKEALSSLAYAGIKTTTYWIIGYPGETEEDFKDTLRLIEELKNDIYEAECAPFEFYLKGQVNSESGWWGEVKKIPLYPPKIKSMLVFQTWLLDCEPSRKVTIQRMHRFVEHCKKLGIPNPYSLHEIYLADNRWKKLHINAVPSLIEVKAMNVQDHGNRAKKKELISARNSIEYGGDFDL